LIVAETVFVVLMWQGYKRQRERFDPQMKKIKTLELGFKTCNP
jgi:hypothetical protein